MIIHLPDFVPGSFHLAFCSDGLWLRETLTNFADEVSGNNLFTTSTTESVEYYGTFTYQHYLYDYYTAITSIIHLSGKPTPEQLADLYPEYFL